MAGRTIWSGEARSAEIAGRRGTVTDGRVGGAGKMMRAVKRRTGNNEPEVNTSKKVGLARALSKLGYCSRSRAAELIAAGRAEPHHVLPDTGWVSRWITSADEAEEVIALFRINYDRYSAAHGEADGVKKPAD